MAANEESYSTIRVKSTLRTKLDSFKVENESYSVVIANLISENERLNKDVEYLKEEKKDLFKLALRTSDSVALVNNVHKATYFISKVVSDRTLTDKDQLKLMEEYLSEMLATDKTSVVITLNNFKDMLLSEGLDVPTALTEYEEIVFSS